MRRGAPASPDPAAARPYTDGHAQEEATTAVLQPSDGASRDLDALVGAVPSTRRRGRLRRRMRHLRRVREVLMRDLGGFVFEVHRSGPGGGGESVMEAKLRRLAAVDAELRELEAVLDDRRPLLLREAGIGGACPRCGELFASEARFCWACGTPVAAGAGHRPELSAASGAPQLDAAPRAAGDIEAAGAAPEAARPEPAHPAGHPASPTPQPIAPESPAHEPAAPGPTAPYPPAEAQPGGGDPFDARRREEGHP